MQFFQDSALLFPYLSDFLSWIGKSGPQEIVPGITSSSWPLFLLIIVQLTVAVVAEDRVGQEELLVSVPSIVKFIQFDMLIAI